jgi:hypothetical protein
MMRSLSADALSAKMNASADRMPLLFRFKACAQQRKGTMLGSRSSMELASPTAPSAASDGSFPTLKVDSLALYKEKWRLERRRRRELLFTSKLLAPHMEFDMWKSPLIMSHDCD